MKIEMGESLLYSWLRHVKECQVVQLNWKLSPKWEIKNKDRLQEVMTRTSAFYEDKYGYSIYKNNSLEQLLLQAEIDVLGITIDESGTHVYAIDVAFHEAGLNYGSKAETVARIVKKCIRSAMCIYGSMDIMDAEILFVSPKINRTVLLEVGTKMEEMDQIFLEMGFSFKTRLIANEEFKGKILDPIILASDGVSDTSELFLRSFQMLQLFKDEASTRQLDIAVCDKHDITEESMKELKIGKMVQLTMKHLFETGALSSQEIVHMTEVEYSKQRFNMNIPVLKEVPQEGDPEQLKKDDRNYTRYYSFLLEAYGKRYLLSAQWVEKLHRSYYERWLKERIEL